MTISSEGITFVLGHAFAMKAIHGGNAKNDKLDSRKIASLLRGGLVPQASVYPAAMRSTRDLLRRRLHLVRKRGQLLTHIQHTRAQYNLPAFERRLAYPANRDGVSAHFADPSVRKRIEVDLAWIDQYDTRIVDLALTIVREAKRHDADAFHRLRSVPGIGNVLPTAEPFRNSGPVRAEEPEIFDELSPRVPNGNASPAALQDPASASGACDVSPRLSSRERNDFEFDRGVDL